jgi:hypothetical protein
MVSLTPIVERLLDALEDAEVAFTRGDPPLRYFAHADDALTALASSVDPTEQPEVSAYLQGVCNACAASLRNRDREGVAMALQVVRPIRAELGNPSMLATRPPPSARARWSHGGTTRR